MFAGSLARSVSLVAAAACAACAGNSAPRGWLPEPEEAQVVAYGGWIELTHEERDRRRRILGELIAVSADSVWVLDDRGGVVIPTATVRKGKLTAYAPQSGDLATWTVVGTLATISNGAFLIFTAPMWIIGGTLVTGNESRAPERRHPPLTWVGLAPYARFPQGMPAGVELTTLQSKRYFGPTTATGNP
jgi:hypothetical protein